MSTEAKQRNFRKDVGFCRGCFGIELCIFTVSILLIRETLLRAESVNI